MARRQLNFPAIASLDTPARWVRCGAATADPAGKVTEPAAGAGCIPSRDPWPPITQAAADS